MTYEFKKVAELEYNKFITLCVIENDENLSSVFSEDFDAPYDLLKNLAQEDKITEKMNDILFDIFDNIILTSTDFVNMYVKLGGIRLDKEEVKEEPETKLIKPKKEKALPKWYGVQQIKKDIEQQGGEVTMAQRTAIEINNLKNTYMVLNSKIIKMIQQTPNNMELGEKIRDLFWSIGKIEIEKSIIE